MENEKSVPLSEGFNPLISVLVPVYNAEDCLDRCVNSILNQSYKNIELILVDDGSTDNSPQICDHYASADKRVRAVHKHNGGIASSRMRLLSEAGGDYYIFADNDDFYLPGVFEAFVKEAALSGAEIIQGQIDECVESSLKRYSPAFSNYNVNESQIISTGDFCRMSLNDKYKFYARNLWGKMYKNSLFNGLKMPNKRFYDGMYLNGLVFDCNKISKISIINITAYCHVLLDSSVSHSWSAQDYVDLFKVYVEIYENSLNLTDDDKIISYNLEYIFKYFGMYQTGASNAGILTGDNKAFFDDIKKKYLKVMLKNKFIPANKKLIMCMGSNLFLHSNFMRLKNRLSRI